MNQNQKETYALVSVKEQDSNQVVNARELHSFLKTGTNFRDWIKRRIDEYRFTENEDFVISLKNERNSKGRSSIEYSISLDMAKELAMVERTEEGRNVRKYFIEVEKKARESLQSNLQINEKTGITPDGVVYITTMGVTTNHVFIMDGVIWAKISPIAKLYNYQSGLNKSIKGYIGEENIKRNFVGKTESYFMNLNGFMNFDKNIRAEISSKQLNGILQMYGVNVETPEANVFAYTYEEMLDILAELTKSPVNKNKVQAMLHNGRKK